MAGSTTTYTYRGTGEEAAKAQVGAATPVYYAFTPGGPLAQRTGTDGATLRYYVKDLHGDVVGLAATTGTNPMKGSILYSPWGVPGTKTGELGTFPAEGRLGFQGDLTDALTGQVDMLTRSYEPTLGRFNTRDVLFGDPMDPVSLNQFVYGADSPVTFTDPTGMFGWSDLWHGIQFAAGGFRQLDVMLGGGRITGGLDFIDPQPNVVVETVRMVQEHGVLYTANKTLNPIDRIVGGVQATFRAWKAGDYYGAGKSAAATSVDTAATIAGVKGLIGGLKGVAVRAAAAESPAGIVTRVARAEAAQGIEHLKTYLSEAEREAFERAPLRGSRFIGQAEHRATAFALEREYTGRFDYHTRGVDFVDRLTNERIELTTASQQASHIGRPGYAGASYALYKLPQLI